MDSILTTLKYKYELVKDAILSGNFDKVLLEIKDHFISNKNTYIVLTFLVVLYTLYEQDYNTNTHIFKLQYRIKHIYQSGGNTIEGPGKTTALKPEMNNKINDNTKEKKTFDNSNSINTESSIAKTSQGVRGLCDGEGTIAKICRGGKDGVTNYFKFFGYLILAGLAILSPFVIYIVLVYMMLKIMFTGLKNI